MHQRNALARTEFAVDNSAKMLADFPLE